MQGDKTNVALKMLMMNKDSISREDFVRLAMAAQTGDLYHDKNGKLYIGKQ